MQYFKRPQLEGVKLACLSLSLLGATNVGAQVPLDISETTFKVGAFTEEAFYYGFCEGDQLIFNFEERNNKGLKELEIIEMPQSSRFMEYKIKRVSNKVLNISKTGIYKFRFANTSIGGRVCNVKIQRMPANEATRTFNSSVYWREVQDTTFRPVPINFLVRSDTMIQEVYSATPQVSSRNALNGNKPFQVLDFTLPENTISWSFYLASGNKGKEEFKQAGAKFAKTTAAAISNIPGYGALGALALTGFSYFSAVQGEDNVKYWFLADGNNANLFMAEQQFAQYKSGDVISEATQMRYPLKGKVYLALLNDNSFEPIKLTLKVVAVTINQQWDSRIEQKMDIQVRQEAYLQP